VDWLVPHKEIPLAARRLMDRRQKQGKNDRYRQVCSPLSNEEAESLPEESELINVAIESENPELKKVVALQKANKEIKLQGKELDQELRDTKMYYLLQFLENENEEIIENDYLVSILERSYYVRKYLSTKEFKDELNWFIDCEDDHNKNQFEECQGYLKNVKNALVSVKSFVELAQDLSNYENFESKEIKEIGKLLFPREGEKYKPGSVFFGFDGIDEDIKHKFKGDKKFDAFTFENLAGKKIKDREGEKKLKKILKQRESWSGSRHTPAKPQDLTKKEAMALPKESELNAEIESESRAREEGNTGAKRKRRFHGGLMSRYSLSELKDVLRPKVPKKRPANKAVPQQEKNKKKQFFLDSESTSPDNIIQRPLVNSWKYENLPLVNSGKYENPSRTKKFELMLIEELDFKKNEFGEQTFQEFLTKYQKNLKERKDRITRLNLRKLKKQKNQKITDGIKKLRELDERERELNLNYKKGKIKKKEYLSLARNNEREMQIKENEMIKETQKFNKEVKVDPKTLKKLRTVWIFGENAQRKRIDIINQIDDNKQMFTKKGKKQFLKFITTKKEFENYKNKEGKKLPKNLKNLVDFTNNVFDKYLEDEKSHFVEQGFHKLKNNFSTLKELGNQTTFKKNHQNLTVDGQSRSQLPDKIKNDVLTKIFKNIETYIRDNIQLKKEEKKAKDLENAQKRQDQKEERDRKKERETAKKEARQKRVIETIGVQKYAESTQKKLFQNFVFKTENMNFITQEMDQDQKDRFLLGYDPKSEIAKETLKDKYIDGTDFKDIPKTERFLLYLKKLNYPVQNLLGKQISQILTYFKENESNEGNRNQKIGMIMERIDSPEDVSVWSSDSD